MKSTSRQRLILLAGGNIFVFVFMFIFGGGIKEQILEVFMFLSFFIGVVIGFFNHILGLKKLWIPITFAPGTFLFLFVILVEGDAILNAYWHEKFWYVAPLISSIIGILLGSSIGILIKNESKK